MPPPPQIKEAARWQSGYLCNGSVLETGHIVRITNQSLDPCRRNTEQQHSTKQIRNLIVCPDSILSCLAFQEYHLIFIEILHFRCALYVTLKGLEMKKD